MKIEVNANSSIRIEAGKVIYFDPFQIEEERHDADIIFVTHDHFDHFSSEDIEKIEKKDTIFVIPECMHSLLDKENVITAVAGETLKVEGYETETIPSYNVGKPFHPKGKGYIGYIVKIEGQRVYVAGDCDANEDNRKVDCDIALIPIGGKYTMDYKEAAGLTNEMKPKLAIPTHYGDVAGDKEDGRKFKELVDPSIEVKLLLHA